MPKKPRGKGYFAVALDMAIAESGLTMDEIERRCEEIGRPVSSVYIGRLRRGLMPPPSNEVSESIALALGIDPDVLLMVGQLERTPDKVQELFIITVRRAAGLLALTEFVLKLDHRAGKFLMNLPEADREHGWRDYWLLKEAIAGGMLDAARDLRDFVFKLQEWLPEEVQTEEILARVRAEWESSQENMSNILEVLFQSVAYEVGKRDPIMRALSDALGIDKAADFNSQKNDAARSQHRGKTSDKRYTQDEQSPQ